MDSENIDRILEKMNAPGLRKKRPGCVVTRGQVEGILSAYSDGYSLRSLVDRFHLTFARIKRLLLLADVDLRPRGVAISLVHARTGSPVISGLKRRKLSPGERDDLCQAYQSGAK